MEKKKVVVLASVLKPVDDTRLFEKLGRSIAKLPNVAVHIAAHQSRDVKSVKIIDKLVLHPIFRFKRKSLSRFGASLKFAIFLHQLRPQLVILSTPELLWVTWLLRIFYGYKYCYDVRENYMLNVQHTGSWRGFGSLLATVYLRLFERPFANRANCSLLAEKCYEEELHWLKTPKTILENRSSIDYQRIKRQKVLLNHWLFSGTLSAYFGVYKAIEFAKAMKVHHPSLRLTVIGYATQPQEQKKLRVAVQNFDWIKLIGVEELVPHKQIIEAIKDADLGLLPYQKSVATAQKVPTKWFEYASTHLPMLAQNHPGMQGFASGTNSTVFVDFSNDSPEKIWKQLQSFPFYSGDEPKDVRWSSQEKDLLNLISTLI